MDKGGAEMEPEPKINNFGSATLLLCMADAVPVSGTMAARRPNKFDALVQKPNVWVHAIAQLCKE